MRRSAGVTLVEVLLALALVALFFAVFHDALRMLARTEKAVEGESSRALVEARALEYLSQDVRSSTSVTSSPGSWVIQRWVGGPAGLTTATVTWSVGPDGVVKRAAGADVRTFAIGAGPLARFRFDVRKDDGATFQP